MADDPMLGLFDSDPTSFLDELTGIPNRMAAQGHSMSLPSNSTGMMGLGAMQQMSGQSDSYMTSMQGHPQQTYSPMSAMTANPQYNTMPAQSSMLSQQYNNMGSYNQYGANSKLHHMSSSMVGGGGQQSNLMGQSPPQQVQQFGSPPPSSPRMQRAAVPSYQSYGMHGGPRMPSPAQQQQMGISQQSSNWNQSTASGQMSYLQQQQRQQQQQSMMGRGVPQMSNYLGQQQQQHEYGMPNSQPMASRLSHFPDQANSNNPMGAGVMQGLGSPSGNLPTRLTHIPMSSPNSMNMLHTQPAVQQYPTTSQPNVNMNSYSSQAMQRMPGDFMQKGVQVVNSGGAPTTPAGTSKLQHFGFQTSPQHQGIPQTTGRGDAPPLTHYPNQSPSQNSPLGQYQSYQNAGTRGAIPSPRPTPPPPSHTPTEMMTSPQGSLQQTGMQSFGGTNQSAVNPFQTRMAATPSPGSTMGMSSGPRQPSNMHPYQNVGFPPNSNMALGVSTTIANTGMGVSQMSPSYRPHLQTGATHDINVEIQQLQQQVKQLYSMPQTQQSQQTMLDLQERMRMLKAQQQQQILQIQQKQRQQQQHQMMLMQQQQQQSSQMSGGQTPVMVSQPIRSPMSQPQISPTSPRKQANTQLGLQTMASQVPVTTLTSSQSAHQTLPPGGAPPPPQVPAPTSALPHTPVLPAATPGLAAIANLSSPMASLVQLTDQQQLPTQQPFTQIHQQTSPILQQQQQLLTAQTPEQRSPSLALAASTPSGAVKPEPQPALDLPRSGQQPVLQSSPPQQSPVQTSPSSMSLHMSQMQPLQDMPGLPFHPQLQVHQTPGPLTEEENLLPGIMNSSADSDLLNVTADQSPVKSSDATPEKKRKKRAKKKPVELGPDGQPLPKPPKKKGPRKKKVKNQEKADQIVAEAIAKAQSVGTGTDDTIDALPALAASPAIPTPVIPTVVNEITDTTADETDTVNVTDISGSEPVEDADTETKPTPTPKKKKSKKESVPKEKKEKKPKIPKARPSKKKPPATFLPKKKKKTGGGSDVSDLDATPPPSPQNEEESGLQKRRSARNTGGKRKKYLDELELNLSEEENPDVDVVTGDGGQATMVSVQFFVDNPTEEDAVVVEKILGMRIRRRDKDEIPQIEGEEQPEEEEEEEFYVKYKNFSYLHCEWRTIKELEKDKRIQMKIKRYKMKRLALNNYFAEIDDEELFNPDYVEVDRVLEVSVTKDPVTEEEVTHFLVKWRSLAYDESTWELQQDVDPNKVEIFNKFKDPIPEEERVHKDRPKKADEWKQLEETPDYKNGNTLREYQLEGLNWLTFSWYNWRNCILADEMGLGKTIQSLTFSHEMFLYGIKGPFLVVAPLSTIANWQREYETWTDMNVITYHGSTPSRIMLQEYEMFFKDEDGHRIPDVYKFHVLITTYEIIIADCDILSQIDWRVAIIDEAHRLKNRNCQLLERLKLFNIEHRVLLTGTPLQNNVEELFSLLNFLEPKTFCSSQAFMSEFGDLRTESQVDKLKAILKPMMLRRLKEDVEKNLAPKEETIVEVELTNIQKKYYRAILERNFTFLAKGVGSSANVPNLMNTMMELRKCCNHPFLIKGAEEKILAEAREKHGNDIDHVFNALVQSCGKLVLIDKLLPKLQQDGHKILIFSQMIRVLDILEDYCVHRKYIYERLDGRIRGNVRQEAIDRFSKPESDRFVFLLCTRAGGLGINLTAADTVIIFDSDWNPQNDLQAQARCHRIGQVRSVKVYRLITRNTYEREMFDKASKKLGLDKAVLQSMGGDKTATQAGNSAMTKKEVEELLRKGAYGALMEDDSAGDKFCEEDIDQILKRRTQVIQIESEGKGSTFAKASFSAAGNRSDISIDDPNFWQKWAKKADLDVDEMTNRNDLIIEEPRQRRQTTRYGNQDNVVDMSDLESSSDTDDENGGKRGKRGKKRRNRDPNDEDFEMNEESSDGSRYTRAECFRVEKNLLVYGWGRWSDILAHGRFKRKLTEKDVETISRALLGYSLQFYKGDERIKGFIGDLVSPDNDAALKNHLGLSAPVPRGRKGKKLKKGEFKNVHSPSDLDTSVSQMNFEDILTDTGYKRHLQRHSNKVLLRVRLLYYLKQEVIGNQAAKVFLGYPSCDIDIPHPSCDGDPPSYWWDEESDRSLLTGVFKHGYEKYNLMRQDPSLVFLSRCGPPDGAAVLAEQNDEENDDFLEGRGRDDEDDDDLETTPMKSSNPIQPPEQFGEGGCLPFPSISELNTRLRRLITSYQRNHKKEQLKMEQKAKRMERREKTELVIKERELKKRESQQHRWSRREEADFYRTVSTFGVEMHKGRYMWDRFRALARLDKKYDHTLTEYFLAFYHMCKSVCKKFREDEDPSPPNNIYVEPITEERATRCLGRIDLLSRIRGEILSHTKLDDRLKLCQPSFDMPEWWICGKHDKDLLIGAARHGVARTDYHILHDPSLCFQEVIQCKTSQLYASKAGLRNSKPDTPSMKGEDDMDDDLSERPPPLLEREGSPVKIEKNEDKENMMENSDKEDLPGKMEVSSSPIKDEPEETDSLKKEPKSPPSKEDSESMEVDEVSPKKELKSSEEPKKSPKPESKSPRKELAKSDDEKDVSKTNGEVDESEKSSDMDGKLVIDMSMNLSHKDDSQSASQNQEPEAPEKTETPVDEAEEEVKPKEEKEDPVKDEAPEKEKPELKPEIKVEKFEDMASSTPSRSQHFPSLFGDESSVDMMGKEATVAELLAQSVHNSTIQWPKDKVVFNRLEHICYAIDHGEWPIVKRSYLLAGGDSRSATPVGASTPKSESLAGDYSLSDAPDSAVEGLKVNYDDDDDEITRDITSVHVSQNDGLKMTFQKRRRRRKLEIEEERARLQQLMNQSAMSSDGESQGEILNYSSTPVSKRGKSSDKLVNGSGARLEESMMMAQALAQAHAQAQAEAQARIQAAQAAAHAHMAQAQARQLGLEPMKKRRGRKRKADKIAELETAARAAAMMEAERQVKRQAMEAAFNTDMRIPVINLEDGSRLSGKAAPRRHEIEKWLDEHPGYMIDRPDRDEEYLQFHIQEALGKRRGRRPRVDPSKLTASSLTGEENVSVINRETGKKITGAKAPPLKYLAEWLQQNPMFDVDPKWGELVRAKGNLPKSMEARVLVPSERRRRSKDYGYPTNLLGDFPFPMMSSMGGLSAASLASAGLMANFPKLPLNVPFGALPNLSMANPMLGLGGFGLPGIPVSTASAAASMSEALAAEEEISKRHKSGDKDSKSSSKSSSAVTTPHPSFPIMYNPLLYNPLFAAQGLRNFTLPPNLPTSFASLAQAGLSNGMPDMEQEEEGEVKHHEKDGQSEAQDLSVHHSRDKKTVREKLEELRSRQKHKDNREKKRSRVSDIVQDLTMKKCSTSPEKAEDLTIVKPKHPKPNRIIDKSNKSKVEGKLERLVAKLKAVDKTKSSPSSSATDTSSSTAPQPDNPSTSVKTAILDSDKTISDKDTSEASKTQESSEKTSYSSDKKANSSTTDTEVKDQTEVNEEDDNVNDKSEEKDNSESS